MMNSDWVTCAQPRTPSLQSLALHPGRGRRRLWGSPRRVGHFRAQPPQEGVQSPLSPRFSASLGLGWEGWPSTPSPCVQALRGGGLPRLVICYILIFFSFTLVVQAPREVPRAITRHKRHTCMREGTQINASAEHQIIRVSVASSIMYSPCKGNRMCYVFFAFFAAQLSIYQKPIQIHTRAASRHLHPFTSFIPITVYLVLRNISSRLRCYHMLAARSIPMNKGFSLTS